MVLITRLAHVCIGAYDLRASEQFYTDVLGMEKAFDFMRDGQQVGFYIKFGQDTFVEVFSQADKPTDRVPLIRHFCLELPDIDAFIAAVRAKGWEISDKKFGPDFAWQAWLKDPAGVDIEVMQYTEKSTHFTGEPCILP